MCKQIDTDMVLYYTLSKRDHISLEKISELHNKLLAAFSGVIVNTTLHSIQESVKGQESLFQISQSAGTYTITRKKDKSNFFDADFLERCYAPFFEEEEFNEIKKILMSDN